MALPIGYHWRNLFVRKTTTVLTVLVVAAVVGAFTWILGFTFALRSSLAVASDARKLIVLQKGSPSETNSNISPEEFNRLVALTTVESDAGVPLISPELYWQTQLPRLRDGGITRANVALRGVTDLSLKVHRNVRLVEGRMFSTGSPEVIVGLSAAKQFAGLRLGDSIKLGTAENRPYAVVGYFSADAGPMESEIWVYLPSMQSAYGRNSYSSASIRLAEGASAEASIKQIEGPSIELGAQTEEGYWRAQSTNVLVYQGVCYLLVFMMALAAMFSLANTMFAMVAGRTREIAMLRTIGFGGGHILFGFVLEAVFLALIGGAIGCAGCWVWLRFVGATKDMFGASSFTTMAFEIHLNPVIVGVALGMVAVVGALGALLPAWRAARVNVIRAMREA